MVTTYPSSRRQSSCSNIITEDDELFDPNAPPDWVEPHLEFMTYNMHVRNLFNRKVENYELNSKEFVDAQREYLNKLIPSIPEEYPQKHKMFKGRVMELTAVATAEKLR
jgi:hypothetical protein